MKNPDVNNTNTVKHKQRFRLHSKCANRVKISKSHSEASTPILYLLNVSPLAPSKRGTCFHSFSTQGNGQLLWQGIFGLISPQATLHSATIGPMHTCVQQRCLSIYHDLSLINILHVNC